MGKHNAAVYILSSRTDSLKRALELFYENWNNEHQYPVYIYHFDDIYSDEFISDVKDSVNENIEFIQIDYGVPSHIDESELFYNRRYLRYVQTSFPKSRLGYLHMEHFSSNFHKYGDKGCVGHELEQYDYIARIDDDSWFKEKIDFDFFDYAVDYPLATGFTWNHVDLNHLETRENLWQFYKDYLKKFDLSAENIKDEQLRTAITDNNEMLMHSLKWSCGNFNIYNVKKFLEHGWGDWMEEINEYGGLYKHRWGDLEALGLFAYTHFDNPLCDLDLRNRELYEPKLPECHYAPSVQDETKRI
jgi:hypothetical protein